MKSGSQDVMETTIYLEAAWHQDHLKIGIRRSDDTMYSYSGTSVSTEMVRMRCREMAENLNRFSRKGGRGTEAFKSIRSVGRMLSDELLTPEIKAYLATTDAEYLMIKLDEHLVHIPWELLCTDEAFFCERFNMGRLVGTRQRIIRGNQRNPGGKPLEMLILANPSGDLVSADSEGETIFRHISRINQSQPVIYPFLDTDITHERIRLKFKDYTI